MIKLHGKITKMVTRAGIEYLKDNLLLRATLVKVKLENPTSQQTTKIIKGFEKSIQTISTVKVKKEMENDRIVYCIYNNQNILISKFSNMEQAYIFIAQNALIIP